MILDIVQEIYESNCSDKYEFFNSKYPLVFIKYPKLCEHACTSTFDFDRFKHLLHVQNQIENRSISQYDGDVQVGNILADAYIKK